MDLEKVEKLPTRKVERYTSIIEQFEKSGMKFAKVKLDKDQKEHFDLTFNSMYQACRRNTRVKCRRYNKTLYLVLVDENGEEL